MILRQVQDMVQDDGNYDDGINKESMESDGTDRATVVSERTAGRPTLSTSMQMSGSAAAENKTNRSELLTAERRKLN